MEPNHTCFHLPADYVARASLPLYFDDLDVEVRQMECQPDVYRMAGELARAMGAAKIVDIGCGRASKGMALAAARFAYVGVDYGGNLEFCRNKYPRHTWLECDLERDAAGLLPSLGDLSQAVVICSDVIEHLVDPVPLLDLLREASVRCLALLVSTPERELTRGVGHSGPPPHPYHVREWAFGEFTRLLREHGFPLVWSGLTRSNDLIDDTATILTICSARDAAENLCRGGLFNLGFKTPQEFATGRSGVVGRIGVVALPEHAGETRSREMELCRTLARHGHRVTLILAGPAVAAGGGLPSREALGAEGIDCETLLPGTPETDPGVRGWAWSLAGYLLEADRENPFDVVHFPESSGLGYYCLQAKAMGQAFAVTTLVVSPRGPLRWRFDGNDALVKHAGDLLVDHLESESIRLADIVISPSNAMFAWFARGGWKPSGEMAVRHCFSEDRISAPPPAGPWEELVFLGDQDVGSGLLLFMETLERHPECVPSNVRITFAGEPSRIYGETSEAFLARRMADLPWEWRVLAGLGHDQSLGLLEQPGRLAVVAARVSNVPREVLHCLDAGLPFLALRSGGLQEYIHPEDLARVTFEAHHDAMAGALARVFSNPPDRARPAGSAEVAAGGLLAWHAWQCAARQAARAAGATGERPPQPGLPAPTLGLVVMVADEVVAQKTLESIAVMAPPPARVDLLCFDGVREPVVPLPEVAMGVHVHRLSRATGGIALADGINTALFSCSRQLDYFYLLSGGITLFPGAIRDISSALWRQPAFASSPALCGADGLAPALLPAGNDPILSACMNLTPGGMVLASALCLRTTLMPFAHPCDTLGTDDLLRLIGIELHFNHYRIQPMVLTVGRISGAPVAPDDRVFPRWAILLPFARRMGELGKLVFDWNDGIPAMRGKIQWLEAKGREDDAEIARLRQKIGQLKEERAGLKEPVQAGREELKRVKEALLEAESRPAKTAWRRWFRK